MLSEYISLSWLLNWVDFWLTEHALWVYSTHDEENNSYLRLCATHPIISYPSVVMVMLIYSNRFTICCEEELSTLQVLMTMTMTMTILEHMIIGMYHVSYIINIYTSEVVLWRTMKRSDDDQKSKTCRWLCSSCVNVMICMSCHCIYFVKLSILINWRLKSFLLNSSTTTEGQNAE